MGSSAQQTRIPIGAKANKAQLVFEDEEEEKDWKSTLRVVNSLKVGI